MVIVAQSTPTQTNPGSIQAHARTDPTPDPEWGWIPLRNRKHHHDRNGFRCWLVGRPSSCAISDGWRISRSGSYTSRGSPGSTKSAISVESLPSWDEQFQQLSFAKWQHSILSELLGDAEELQTGQQPALITIQYEPYLTLFYWRFSNNMKNRVNIKLLQDCWEMEVSLKQKTILENLIYKLQSWGIFEYYSMKECKMRWADYKISIIKFFGT